MADLPLRTVKPLCTKPEYQLLESTVGPALSRQSPAELVATRSLLRGFRDKWRTQTNEQRRRVRASRGGDAQLSAARSDAKQLAFQEALARVEQHIERVGVSKVRTSVKTKAPRVRSADHRQERAVTRKALGRSLDAAESKRAGSGAVRLKQGRPLKTNTSAASSSAHAPEVKPRAKALKPTTMSGTTSRSKKNTNAPRALGPNTGRVSGSSAGADAAAKASQLRRGGLRSRTLGHVSAQGRRNQARRDFVNRKEA